MKKNQIKEGECYFAKVSDRLTTVRVDKIRSRCEYNTGGTRERTVYDVTNLATGRRTVFRSAQKFRGKAKSRPVPAQLKEPPKPQVSVTGARSRRKPLVLDPDEPENLRPLVGLADRLRGQAVGRADRAPHLVVEARAGTGKTTTLVEGLKHVTCSGDPRTAVRPSIEPSPQQAAIWEAMKLSKGKAQSICFVAFNKSIATELQNRVPPGCDAMTMHSMGFKAVMQQFGRVQVNSYRVQDIVSELLETDIRELRRSKPVVLKATEQLVGLCKMNLVAQSLDTSSSVEQFRRAGERWRCGGKWSLELTDLAAHYDVDLDSYQVAVFDLVPRVLERCKDVDRDNYIDFNDMIWLPVALDLPVHRYDLLLVDEAQDLNRCQQQLALKAGRRLILCGDPKQAIYGFAGADARSMPRMTELLSMTNRGCVTLPLTVTRRCGKAIVEEARKIVPDFEAHESCGKGKISRMVLKGEHIESPGGPKFDYQTVPYAEAVKSGDMILCRVNAPLVSECFRFLRAGRKANIQGRDVGQGLISTIQKLMKNYHPVPTPYTGQIPTLLSRLSDWLYKEQRKESAKRNPSDAKLIALEDRYDCLVCFTEGADAIDAVVKKIEAVFTDDKGGDGIKLSSIHKAKGLEAKRVFLLQPEGAQIPHPMAKSPWQREQETNILYVAVTRAIEELVYVS